MLEFKIHLKRSNFHMAVNGHVDQLATGLFGPSGSGKSTLLSCLTGATTPDTGRIVLNGRVLFDSQRGIHVPTHKRRVGIVFQDSLLLPHLSVRANLGYGMPKSARRDREDRILEIAEILGITDRLESLPQRLSGGEKQRVALGRTLLAQPDLVLLDEPFSGLDTELKNTLLPFVQELHMRIAVPILLVSHDLRVIQYFTDHVLLMDHGKLIGQGPLHELSRQVSTQGLWETCGFNNTFEVVVAGHRPRTGMTCYSVLAQGPSGKGARHLRIKLKGLHQPGHTSGQSFSCCLSSRDIALALAPVDYISMQNQMPGYITDITCLPGRHIAVIDVGIKLLVEITARAVMQLGLCVGQKIWCLFKAPSLRFVPKLLPEQAPTMASENLMCTPSVLC